MLVEGTAHVTYVEPNLIQSVDRRVIGHAAFDARDGATINLKNIPTFGSGASSKYTTSTSGIINFPVQYALTKAGAMPSGIFSGRVTIATDGVAIIAAPADDLTANIEIIPLNPPAASCPVGTWWGRATGSPACTVVAKAAVNTTVDTTTGVLTGTTGTAGHFTISYANDGNIYLENRSGGSLTLLYLLKGR